MKSIEIPLVVANEHGIGQAESQNESEGDVVGKHHGDEREGDCLLPCEGDMGTPPVSRPGVRSPPGLFTGG